MPPKLTNSGGDNRMIRMDYAFTARPNLPHGPENNKHSDLNISVANGNTHFPGSQVANVNIHCAKRW